MSVFSSHFVDLWSINSPSQVGFILQRKDTNGPAIDLKMTTTVKAKKPSRVSKIFLCFGADGHIFSIYFQSIFSQSQVESKFKAMFSDSNHFDIFAKKIEE